MEFLADFHFLRPFWLLLVFPAMLLSYFLWKQQKYHTGLEHHIQQNLLSYLSFGKPQKVRLLPFFILTLIWLISIIALAGPTWKKLPQPLFTSESAVIIILDLSPSMLAEDIKPSRIIRAHLKIQDLLSQRKEGVTALIVYAGEAHVVTPLTNDSRTISNLLPTLKPGILPIPGSNIEMAIELAEELVQASRTLKASLFIVTDDVSPDALPTIKNNLSSAIDITILGVGTEAGSPIPHKGEFLKDSNGEIIIAKHNSNVMKELANAVEGYYLPIQSNSSDIEFFQQHIEQRFSKQLVEEKEGKFNHDLWYEYGPILLTLLLPIIAFSFRRGYLLGLITISLSISSFTPQPAYASWWDSLWKNDDQRGLKALELEEYDAALEHFNDSQWKGTTQFKAGNYEAALNEFKKDASAIGDYNQGNALANLQRYNEAIEAYNKALEKDPSFSAAQKNKETVEALKKEQEHQQDKETQENSEDATDSEKSNESQENENSQQNQTDQSQANNDKIQSNNQKGDGQQSNTEQLDPDSTEQTQSNQQQTRGVNSQKELDGQQSTITEGNNDSKASESLTNAEQLAQNLSEEERQSLQQWLRKVPDDPSGLVRRKFDHEFQKRRQLYRQGDWKLPKNNAHKRY